MVNLPFFFFFEGFSSVNVGVDGVWLSLDQIVTRKHHGLSAAASVAGILIARLHMKFLMASQVVGAGLKQSMNLSTNCTET